MRRWKELIRGTAAVLAAAVIAGAGMDMPVRAGDPDVTPQDVSEIEWKTIDNKVPVFEVIFSPMPQTQCDQIMELYNAVSAIYTTDNALWEIISEQAQPYFAGDKSVDEAARLIQSRAELYVNERK